MQQLVEYLVKRLVDHPDEVRVVPVEGERVITYEVTVAPDDLGKVIGRGGRIARAMRTLVRAVQAEDGRRYSVEIIS